MANAVDKEQIKMLADWWKNYGRSIAWGVVVALVLVFGFKFWNQHKMQHRLDASASYQALLSAAQSHEINAAALQLEQLQQKYADTPYAAIGAMLTARLYVEAQQPDKAAEQLTWVINNSSVKSFKQLARINEGRLLIAQKKYDAAELVLTNLDDPAFKAFVDDLRGQLYMAKGDIAHAKQAFDSARQAFQEANITDALVTMQLNSLARE